MQNSADLYAKLHVEVAALPFMQLSMAMCKCHTIYNVHCQDPARLLLQSFQKYAANTNAAPHASSEATQACNHSPSSTATFFTGLPACTCTSCLATHSTSNLAVVARPVQRWATLLQPTPLQLSQ
jgi:hypothetical protein